MFYSTVVLAATAAFTGLASAQNYSVTSNGTLQIDPAQVEISQRRIWCQAQRVTCAQLCDGQASPNTCDPDTLDWGCQCVGGSTPNVTDYQQTAPSYICEAWRGNCVRSNPDDSVAQRECEAVTCGTRNATAEATSGSGNNTSSDDDDDDDDSSSGSGSSSGSDGSSSGGSSNSDDSSDSSDSSSSDSDSSNDDSSSSDEDSAALTLGINYGTGALALGLMALFGFAL